jgi:hypothetical protein
MEKGMGNNSDTHHLLVMGTYRIITTRALPSALDPGASVPVSAGNAPDGFIGESSWL